MSRRRWEVSEYMLAGKDADSHEVAEEGRNHVDTLYIRYPRPTLRT